MITDPDPILNNLDKEDSRREDARNLTEMLLPDQRVHVFVSSTLGELKPERDVARQVIRDLDLFPIVFEAGARPYPPRDVYRSYLRGAHIFVAIYWESYGWIAPDMEISGIEDELHSASAMSHMPRLVYVKQPAKRDPRLQMMLDSISDEVTYVGFSTLEDLAHLLKSDLAQVLSERFLLGASPLPSGTTATPPDFLAALQSDMQARGVLPRPNIIRKMRDQLQSSKRLLLVGLPGAGKTFLLGAFGKELESVYLSLTNQTTQQACQYLANRLRILRGIPPRSLPSEGEARASLQEELAASNCVLLIDHADQNPETAAAIAVFTPFNCSLVFAGRTADATIYHNAITLKVPPFTREEIQAFFKVHGYSSPPGELEYLCTVSHGNPLYLYYFVTQKVTPLPDGLRAYQEALIGQLSSDQLHVLAFIALSIVPLDLLQMHQLLLQDGTITGHALRTRELVSTIGALVRSVDGRLELFHPYFREFIEADIEQARLAKEYHLRLAEQAIKAQWVYPAAYHLCHAQDPRERDYLLEGARVANLHGRWKDSEDFLYRLIDIARIEHDAETQVNAQFFLSELLTNMGRHVDARDWIRKALELAQSEGLSELLFGIELWSIVLHVDDDRPEETIAFLQQALEQHKGSGSHAEAGILFNLSFAYLHTSKFRQGAEAAMRAREIFLALDMEDEADSCIINLCACLLEGDNSTKPLKYLRDLLGRAKAKNLPRVEAGALNLLAKASRSSNKPEEAVEFSRQAIQIWQRLGFVEKTALNLANLGNAYKDLGRLEEAERAYLEAQRLAIEHNLAKQHAFCLELMCALRLKQERISEAVEFGTEALAMHRRAANPLRIVATLVKLGESYKLAARKADAIMAFEEAAHLYGTIEIWDDVADAFEAAAKLERADSPECVRFIERGVQAGVMACDAMQVVRLLEIRQPPDLSPPYRESLEYLLNQPMAPHMGLFMTNVALHAGTLSPTARDELLQGVIGGILTRAVKAEGLGLLIGLAVALIQTASCIPHAFVCTIREKVQEFEGVYYRARSDGSGIWTIGLAWEKPVIVQIDMLSEYPFVQRIALVLVLYLLANGKTFGELVGRLGGNSEEGLRFMLVTEGDFKTHILQSKDGETGVTPENPVTVMESGVPWGEPQPPAVVVLHDNFEHIADISTTLNSMAPQLLLAHFTLDFIAHFTHSSRESVKESLSIVREAFH
jgi:tetratricopeptide (TPR) repeat protein